MTLQKLLGTELPLIQAPMAGAQGSALAVAVSNAGGLGSLPALMNAVVDALRPAGVRHFEMPATPQRVWDALQAARI